jgi:hypothetical protein
MGPIRRGVTVGTGAPTVSTPVVLESAVLSVETIHLSPSNNGGEAGGEPGCERHCDINTETKIRSEPKLYEGHRVEHSSTVR